jgi:hypothetical protein
VLRFLRETATEHDPALLPRPAAGEGLDLAGDGDVSGVVGIDVVKLIGSTLKSRRRKIIIVRGRQLAN